MVRVAFLHGQKNAWLASRDTISMTARQSYILRVRELAKVSCRAWRATVGGSSHGARLRERVCSWKR
jgi:glycyl-tRNA synthetase alpha subunit